MPRRHKRGTVHENDDFKQRLSSAPKADPGLCTCDCTRDMLCALICPCVFFGELTEFAGHKEKRCKHITLCTLNVFCFELWVLVFWLFTVPALIFFLSLTTSTAVQYVGDNYVFHFISLYLYMVVDLLTQLGPVALGIGAVMATPPFTWIVMGGAAVFFCLNVFFMEFWEKQISHWINIKHKCLPSFCCFAWCLPCRLLKIRDHIRQQNVAGGPTPPASPKSSTQNLASVVPVVDEPVRAAGAGKVQESSSEEESEEESGSGSGEGSDSS